MIMTRQDRGLVAMTVLIWLVIFLLSGCAKPTQVTETLTIDRPVLVHCTPAVPAECLNQYAVDALHRGSDPVQESRAIRAELEQRQACELKLRAALQGCAK